jgi:hypothetical protein
MPTELAGYEWAGSSHIRASSSAERSDREWTCVNRIAAGRVRPKSDSAAALMICAQCGHEVSINTHAGADYTR